MDLKTVMKLVRDSDQLASNLEDSDSMSGSSLRQFLIDSASRLVTKESCYLELGVFRGGTLLQIANSIVDGVAIGIDNFSLFNEGRENENHIRQEIKNQGLHNVELIPLDFEIALKNFENIFPNLTVGLLLVDGAHDYRSQIQSLLLAKKLLAKTSLIVVDDANYAHVRQAGYDFVNAHPEWIVACEVLTENHPNQGVSSRWWNGMQVITRAEKNVLSKQGELKFSSDPGIEKVLERLAQTHDLLRHKTSPVFMQVLDEVAKMHSKGEDSGGFEKYLSQPSVISRTLHQNVDVPPDRIGITELPSGHLARLSL